MFCVLKQNLEAVSARCSLQHHERLSRKENYYK